MIGQWKCLVNIAFTTPTPFLPSLASLPADVSTHHVTRANVFPDGVCSCAVSKGNLVTFPVSLIVMTSSLLASLMNMRTATGEQPTQQQQHVVVKIDSEKINNSKSKIKFFDGVFVGVFGGYCSKMTTLNTFVCHLGSDFFSTKISFFYPI